MGDQLNQPTGQVERVLAEPERDELVDSSQNIFQQKKLPGGESTNCWALSIEGAAVATTRHALRIPGPSLSQES